MLFLTFVQIIVPIQCNVINGKSSILPSNKLRSRSTTVSECFTDWKFLAVAVRTSHALEEESGTFYICPNTIMTVERPIEIASDGYEFVCGGGQNTEPGRNCVIRGGWSHFKIVGSVNKIYFRNLSFTDATTASIIAAGEEEASVDFVECVWSSNTGKAAILIYNEAKGVPITDQVSISDLVESREPSMTVRCMKCIFASNQQLEHGTILSMGGSVSFKRSLFVGNLVNVGLISSKFKGSVAISDSCFLLNQALLPGIVRVDYGGLLTANKDTYGFNNTSRFGSCEQIFLEVGESCTDNTNVKCVGICADFTSQDCQLDLQDPKIQSVFDWNLLNVIGDDGEDNADGTTRDDGNSLEDEEETAIWEMDQVTWLIYIIGGAAAGGVALCAAITFSVLICKSNKIEYTGVASEENQNNDDDDDDDGSNNDESKSKKLRLDDHVKNLPRAVEQQKKKGRRPGRDEEEKKAEDGDDESENGEERHPEPFLTNTDEKRAERDVERRTKRPKKKKNMLRNSSLATLLPFRSKKSFEDVKSNSDEEDETNEGYDQNPKKKKLRRKSKKNSNDNSAAENSKSGRRRKSFVRINNIQSFMSNSKSDKGGHLDSDATKRGFLGSRNRKEQSFHTARTKSTKSSSGRSFKDNETNFSDDKDSNDDDDDDDHANQKEDSKPRASRSLKNSTTKPNKPIDLLDDVNEEEIEKQEKEGRSKQNTLNHKISPHQTRPSRRAASFMSAISEGSESRHESVNSSSKESSTKTVGSGVKGSARRSSNEFTGGTDTKIRNNHKNSGYTRNRQNRGSGRSNMSACDGGSVLSYGRMSIFSAPPPHNDDDASLISHGNKSEIRTHEELRRSLPRRYDSKEQHDGENGTYLSLESESRNGSSLATDSQSRIEKNKKLFERAVRSNENAARAAYAKNKSRSRSRLKMVRESSKAKLQVGEEPDLSWNLNKKDEH